MTPEEFKSIRKNLGLTQETLSDALGKHTRTIQRYEKGELMVPPSVEKMLYLMRAHRKIIERPDIIENEIQKSFMKPLNELNEASQTASTDPQNYVDTPAQPETP